MKQVMLLALLVGGLCAGPVVWAVPQDETDGGEEESTGEPSEEEGEPKADTGAEEAEGADEAAGEPGEAGEPAPDALAVKPGKPWLAAGRIEFRFVYSNLRTEVLADHLVYRHPAGFVLDDPPFTTGMADHRTGYMFEETGGRVEAGFGVLDFLSLHLGIGWVSTDLTLIAENGNVISGTRTHFESTASGDLGFTFDFRADAHYPIMDDGLFVGGSWALRYGLAEFERQTFFTVNSDGEMDWISSDVRLRLGWAATDMISVWAGLSMLLFDGDVRFKDKRDFAGPDRWDFDLEVAHPARGIFGFALHPVENVNVTVEAAVAEVLSVEMGVGVSF